MGNKKRKAFLETIDMIYQHYKNILVSCDHFKILSTFAMFIHFFWFQKNVTFGSGINPH